VADAVHSLSDFITDIIVLIFVRISNKPEDKGHEFGHGKYETLATAIIGILLCAVGLGICWNGCYAIYTVWAGGQLPAPGTIALWGAIISIISKEWLYRYTIRIGRKIGSDAVIANAWHHRSDALSSIGTAIGIGGAIFLDERWRVLDPLAAVIVSFFIMKVAIKLLKPCIDELMESALPEDVEQQIADITQSIPGVSSLHHLRTRRIGSRYAIEMHVRMDGRLPLYDAHAKASVIEQKLKENFGNETHVIVHVEPTQNTESTY
ncbi:MAG: cation diffusion facilitator family transporter, partial [Paraprevotella sp.]|nr:cation diffusion facilitator family transporter [Paraprevotella sp.]